MATIFCNLAGALDAAITDDALHSAIYRDTKTLISSHFMVVTAGSYEEIPKIIHRPGKTYLVYGSPTISTSSSPETVCDMLSKSGTKSLDQVDSSFLIVEISENKNQLVVITDRFNSRPMWWSRLGPIVILSTEFRRCLQTLRARGPVTVDLSAIYEFLWFRRLYGTKSYVSEINMIRPAAIRFFDQNADSESRYWHYKHQHSLMSDSNYVDLLAESISSGVHQSVSDVSRNGLMLSGGLDSRLMLMIGNKRYTGITNAPQINNEVHIAKKLADLAAIEHFYIERPKDYLGKIFDNATKASNGMTLYYECQFLGYAHELTDMVDNIQLGLFFDIFFCGHYMPKYHPQFLGRNALFFLPRKVDETDFVQSFAHSVSYRQKQSDLSSLVANDNYHVFKEIMMNNLKELEAEGRKTGLSGEGLWEYMHLANLGRHYSMLMAKSMRPYIDVRLPALTNTNYSMALSLPTALKRNWRVYLNVLKKLDYELGLMELPNSNTNIQAKYNLYAQTAFKLGRGVSKKLGLLNSVVTPAYSDRSWPPVLDSFLANRDIQDRLNTVIENGYLSREGLLDKRRLFNLRDETLSGGKDHSIFLNQLLTIEYGALDLM
tara:strand:- start:3452 stop:5263 length:1812 start_codon:yes stop_codon:yes gene_type:complete